MKKPVIRNALKHGGAAGLKRLTDGGELTGPAATAEIEVKDDYRDNGAAGIIEKQATRLEAVSRLYYEAFIAAIQAGNLAQADSYVARYGWLANSSVRAWETVRKNEKSRNKHDAGRVLEAITKDGNNDRE